MRKIGIMTHDHQLYKVIPVGEVGLLREVGDNWDLRTGFQAIHPLQTALVQCLFIVIPLFNGLVSGKSYRKAPYLMGKSDWFPVKICSLEPIWVHRDSHSPLGFGSSATG